MSLQRDGLFHGINHQLIQDGSGNAAYIGGVGKGREGKGDTRVLQMWMDYSNHGGTLSCGGDSAVGYAVGI